MEQHAGALRTLPYVGMMMVVAANVVANSLIKLGANQPADRALFGIITWQTVMGVGSFATALVLYAWVLRRLPLFVATSMSVLQYVGVILVAALLFMEPISVRQWVGIGVLMIGLLLVVT